MTLSELIDRLQAIEKSQGGFYGNSTVKVVVQSEGSATRAFVVTDVEDDFPSDVFIIA